MKKHREREVTSMKLMLNALTKFAAGLILLGLLLFAPAGTFHYPNAWLFLALLFIPMFVLGIVLLWKSPALLEKRLNTKEKEATQKGVVGLSALMFVGGFVIAALDYRFGWTHVPSFIVGVAAVIQLGAYAMYAEVMRENVYLSRTVEVQKDQKIVDTGLYGIVRHPMYLATILLFLAMPVVLGSWIAFAVFLLYPAAIAVRIGNEEKVLEEGLEGYTEYKKKVRYRLIPFIW